MHRASHRPKLLLALALAGAASASAQAPPGPLLPRPGAPLEKAAPPTAAATKPPIKIQVNLVSTPVTVRDPKGELVLDLSEKDFRVFDNGAEQKIEHFDLGGDPLSIVLVAETSSRIEPLLPAVRATGIVFTEAVMGPTADAAVVGYDDQINLLVPFTSDQERVQKMINTLPKGPSGARLYDALGRAVSLLRQRPENRRRIVLVISEAVDTGSEQTLGEVLRQAQLANVAIYAIGLSTVAAEFRAKPSQAAPPQIGPPGTFPEPPLPGRPQTPSMQAPAQGNIDLLALAALIIQSGTNAHAEHALALATAATGGTHVSTRRDRALQPAMDQIGGELHAQYTLAYRPPGQEPSGYHEIRVEVRRPGVKVRTRPGYYLAPPAS